MSLNEAASARVIAGVGPIRLFLRLAWPVVDVVVRVGTAQAFLKSGMSMVGHWTLTVAVARRVSALATMDPVHIASLEAAVAIIAPMFLVTGFLTRPAALALLALSIAFHSSEPSSADVFLMALAAWYAVLGAEALSLDRLLQRGIARSALPLAELATRIGAWLELRAGPVSQLALRFLLATSLIAVPLTCGLLPSPETDGLLPPVGWILAALLAAGLGTPVVAGSLLLMISGRSMFASVSPAAIDQALLYALVAVKGAGPLSLDGVFWSFLNRRPIQNDAEPTVVIVGAGFAGMACAAGLRHERAKVVLIDKCNYHLFAPLLYQVATASLSPADIAAPIRAVFRDEPRVTVLLGSMTGLDPDHRLVILEDRAVSYDHLVLATGATHSYFGHDEWAPHAPGLKFIEDALAVRSRILTAFEKAEATDDLAMRESLMTFIVCGGGATGVELAGAIAEIAHHGLDKEFRRIDPAQARVLLVQSGPRLLPQFPERLSARAERSLVELGVEIRTNTRVEAIDARGAMVGDKRIEAATILWAAGVVASDAAKWVGVTADRSGRLPVEKDLSVPGWDDVFAIGDTVTVAAWNEKPVPALAPAAKQEGAYVARVLRARLRRRAAPPPFRYRHQGSLATIGRMSAVVDLGSLAFSGAPAWWVWGLVHIIFLGGVRNRTSVILGWAWSYFTYRVNARMITAEMARPNQAA